MLEFGLRANLKRVVPLLKSVCRGLKPTEETIAGSKDNVVEFRTPEGTADSAAEASGKTVAERAIAATG